MRHALGITLATTALLLAPHVQGHQFTPVTDSFAAAVRAPILALKTIALTPERLLLGREVSVQDVHVVRVDRGGFWVSERHTGDEISRFAMRDDKTLFLFVFRDEYLIPNTSSWERDRTSVLADIFADVGWECPQILAAMSSVGEIYFDRVSQIRMTPGREDGRLSSAMRPHACRSWPARAQGWQWRHEYSKRGYRPAAYPLDLPTS